MGFLWDIVEIAGLLFIAYMAGWIIGYLVHRLTARAPAATVVVAAQPAAAAAASPADALVKAPVVVPVTSAPPPQVMATVAAVEPVKATAVPDTGEARDEAPPAAPSAPVSGIDRLKSLSTRIPLTPLAAVAPVSSATPAETIVPQASPPPTLPVESIASTISSAAAEPPVRPEPTVMPASAPEVTTAPPPVSPAAAAAVAAEPATPPPQPIPPETTERIEAPFAGAPPDQRDAPTSALVDVVATAEQVPGADPAPPVAPVATAVPAAPASTPGMPWAGALNGHAAQKFAPEAMPPEPTEDEIAEPDAALDVALLSSLADELRVAPSPGALELAPSEEAAPAAEAHAVVTTAAIELPVPKATAPEAEPEPAPATPELVAPAPVASPPAVPRRPTLDEDAAMRAIEGGWSRRDVRALPDAPELADVNAAVSAAQVAVEQVLARNGVAVGEPESRAQASFGKPAGLAQPRDGRRDNLRRIDGLGPLDEVALNNLGIYHFDQVAKWTEREILWLENHAFAVGRIGREDWQEQARELIAERDATRALR